VYRDQRLRYIIYVQGLVYRAAIHLWLDFSGAANHDLTALVLTLSFFAGLAAGKGNLNATVSLGEAYIEGLGVQIDADYGLGLLKVAAKGGCRAGYRALGMCNLEVSE